MSKNNHILRLFPELASDLATIHTTGVFPSQKIEELIRSKRILTTEGIAAQQIQPASLDLRLGAIGYRIQTSFLPGRSATVLEKVADLRMAEIDLTRPAVLEQRCVYLVPLMEHLDLPQDVSGKANPRSTAGRLDIFTRLITDHGDSFDVVPRGYKGPLFAEIVPGAFTVVVAAGTRLNQIRFVRGAPPPSDNKLAELNEKERLVYSDNGPGQAQIQSGLRISVSLRPENGAAVIGYRAKRNAPVLEFDRTHYYDPMEFWEPVFDSASKGLILNPGDFYILGSRERMRVPPTHAAEMVPFDPSLGEFRIHYAGFFDPGFGYGADDIDGTKAVLEVRSHEIPFLIEDGQTVGRLVYGRLLQPPTRIYGVDIGSSYQRQALSLGRQFKPCNL